MKRTSALLIFLCAFLELSACMPVQRTPNDGVWYCADLQAQFSVDKGDGFVSMDYVHTVDEAENYIIVDGDRIASLLSNDRGSMDVHIICQEPNNLCYGLGEIIYSLKFVNLSDTEYTLKDETGKQYTFLRIGDTPSDN